MTAVRSATPCRRRTSRSSRADLIRYAGASGDFNVIHWNERVATSVGLPDVIAHGMFTMATAVRVVTDWTGDPAAVVEYGVRFTRPVVVPDPDGAVLHVEGVGRAIRDDGLVEVDLTATVDGQTVLAKARAVDHPAGRLTAAPDAQHRAPARPRRADATVAAVATFGLPRCRRAPPPSSGHGAPGPVRGRQQHGYAVDPDPVSRPRTGAVRLGRLPHALRGAGPEAARRSRCASPSRPTCPPCRAPSRSRSPRTSRSPSWSSG